MWLCELARIEPYRNAHNDQRSALAKHKKKRETFVPLSQYPEPGSNDWRLRQSSLCRGVEPKNANARQPHIKVSTATLHYGESIGVSLWGLGCGLASLLV